jgi:hypothetical protein
MNSGHLSSLEIAMTVVVGAASIAGIIAYVKSRKSLAALPALGLAAAFFAIQFICMRISLLPSIANR